MENKQKTNKQKTLHFKQGNNNDVWENRCYDVSAVVNYCKGNSEQMGF